MSSSFWNYLELPTPVILSSTLNCRNAYGAASNLRSIMISIKNTLNDLKQLNLEAAALSRLIYRTKYKLRQEKSFKALQMINRCLTNYLSIHLSFTVNTIHDSLVDDRGPSRQMLEWALVRLLSVAHLFHRVYSLCTQAAGHLFVRMKLVQMYELTFFAVAVISRIWTYAQFMVRKCCEWYSSLYQFLDKLQPSLHPWIPEGCALIIDLAAALGNPAYLNLNSVRRPDELISQLNGSLSESDKAQINGKLPAILDDNDIGEALSRESPKKKSVIEQEIDELSLHISGIKKAAERKPKKNQKVNNLASNKQPPEEIESPVQDNQKAIKTKANLKPLKTNCSSYSHSIKSIKSSKDLLKFLEVETDLRKLSSNAELIHQPLMKNCDKLQWCMIEKCIKKHVKLLLKSEEFGNVELQEKLLRRIRKNIKSWICS